MRTCGIQVVQSAVPALSAIIHRQKRKMEIVWRAFLNYNRMGFLPLASLGWLLKWFSSQRRTGQSKSISWTTVAGL